MSKRHDKELNYPKCSAVTNKLNTIKSPRSRKVYVNVTSQLIKSMWPKHQRHVIRKKTWT